jgi:protein ImuB
MLCVWLPRFLTDRLSRSDLAMDAPPEALLAVTNPGKGGNRLVAVNLRAEKAGLRAGMLLTDATAIAPELRAVPQDLREEAAHLRRLALWGRRYTPWVAPEEPDGLRLDITGCAHLFGGESALLRGVRDRFEQAGFACRAAIASTPAAAWGMARYGRAGLSIVPEAEERERLAPLPPRALRIAPEKATALGRLGIKSIGQLLALPRSQLRTRFGTEIATRLDQALGYEREALDSLLYETVYSERLDFAEPVSTLPAIELAAGLLIDKITPQLQRDGKGTRKLTLSLFDTRGMSTDIDLTLARPSQKADHLRRLFKDRFAALEGRFAQDVAFDAATLLATRIELLKGAQAKLMDSKADDDGAALAPFLDRLGARLGEGAIRRFAFRESHVPERAAVTVPVLRKAVASPAPAAAPRPFMLLPRPEEISAMAVVPDYPPVRFTWRRMHYRVIKAEGPEQIGSEWWRGTESQAASRNYYAVEVENGRRFWIFRKGFYGNASANAQWFMHGFLP